MADIAQTEDADHPLALIHHRQPANLEFLHVPHRFSEVIVFPAAMNARCYHIPCRRVAGVEVKSTANPRQTMSRSVTMPIN